MVMNKIKKGDNVQVMLGKDSGKTGAVERVLVKESKVVIAGINVFKRHVKGRPDMNMEGGIIDIVKPINISNVQLVCPSCKKPTRVGFTVTGDTKTRVCRKCGKEIK
jgi:large subunit ribosomal protein L24